jgi:hypothetical protein
MIPAADADGNKTSVSAENMIHRSTLSSFDFNNANATLSVDACPETQQELLSEEELCSLTNFAAANAGSCTDRSSGSSLEEMNNLCELDVLDTKCRYSYGGLSEDEMSSLSSMIAEQEVAETCGLTSEEETEIDDEEIMELKRKRRMAEDEADQSDEANEADAYAMVRFSVASCSSDFVFTSIGYLCTIARARSFAKRS